MNRKFVTVLSAVFALVPLTIHAQDYELLTPLTESEEADARAKNDYYIRKFTYAAKRYRLVKVNSDVLMSKGPISIRLFDDVSLNAEAKSVDIDKRTGAITWIGRLAQPGFRSEDLLDQLHTVEAADLVFEALTRVEIYTFLHEVDKASGANLEILIDPRELLAPAKINRFENAKNDSNQFYGVSATLIPQTTPGRYELTILGMGGPYHILYEIDESKLIIPDNVDGPINVTDDPERARKMREYEAFRESLGEDPREAIIVERLQRAGLLQ